MFNFFAAGRNRELLKNAKPDDLIAIGYYTPNKGDVPTQPQVRAIKVKDFLAGVPEAIDKNDQVLELGGEGDELRLSGGTNNGTPIPDSTIPISSLKPALGIIAETNVRAEFNVVSSETVLNNDIGLKFLGNLGVNVIRGGVGLYTIEWDEGVITNPNALQVIISSAGAPGFAQAYVTNYSDTGVGIKVADLNGSPLDGAIFEIAIKYFG